MRNAFKSIVSSIQTATSGYFTPQHLQEHTAINTSPQTPTHATMAPASIRRELFKDVVYYDTASVLEERHRQALKNGDATEYKDEGDSVNWGTITHVFTLEMDFPGQKLAAKQPGLVIVTVSSDEDHTDIIAEVD
jgi:hypothetical protein